MKIRLVRVEPGQVVQLTVLLPACAMLSLNGGGGLRIHLRAAAPGMR